MDTKRGRVVAAGEFKQKCLAMLDEVSETHDPLLITKRGCPVARVVPVETSQQIEDEILGELRSLAARMLVSETEFVSPTDGLA